MVDGPPGVVTRWRVVRSVATAALVCQSACATAPVALLDTWRLPSLPDAVANNAVAVVQGPRGPTLFSLLGLGIRKTYANTRSDAWQLGPGDAVWRRLPDASMDQRGLLDVGNGFVLVGGMDAGRRVRSDVIGFRLP